MDFADKMTNRVPPYLPPAINGQQDTDTQAGERASRRPPPIMQASAIAWPPTHRQSRYVAPSYPLPHERPEGNGQLITHLPTQEYFSAQGEPPPSRHRPAVDVRTRNLVEIDPRHRVLLAAHLQRAHNAQEVRHRETLSPFRQQRTANDLPIINEKAEYQSKTPRNNQNPASDTSAMNSQVGDQDLKEIPATFREGGVVCEQMKRLAKVLLISDGGLCETNVRKYLIRSGRTPPHIEEHQRKVITTVGRNLMGYLFRPHFREWIAKLFCNSSFPELRTLAANNNRMGLIDWFAVKVGDAKVVHQTWELLMGDILNVPYIFNKASHTDDSDGQSRRHQYLCLRWLFCFACFLCIPHDLGSGLTFNAFTNGWRNEYDAFAYGWQDEYTLNFSVLIQFGDWEEIH